MKLSTSLPIALSLPHATAYSVWHRPSRPRYVIRVQPEARSQPSLLQTARALQSQMDPFFRDTYDPFDPFEMESLFYPRRTVTRRNINNNLNSMANMVNAMQSLDDATNLIMRSKTMSKRREIEESPDKYEIFIDVPEGMEAKDITLELVRNEEVLHLSGVHKAEKENIVSESRISRMFTLGKNADVSKISAKLSDGVVEVTVPKVEVDKVKESRKIEISEEKVRKKNKAAEEDEDEDEVNNIDGEGKSDEVVSEVKDNEGTEDASEEEMPGDVEESIKDEKDDGEWEEVKNSDDELEITEE